MRFMTFKRAVTINMRVSFEKFYVKLVLSENIKMLGQILFILLPTATQKYKFIKLVNICSLSIPL